LLVTSLGSDKPDTPPDGATASYGLRIGKDDAAKKIVVYEDFLCPFCGQLEATVRDQLDTAVVAGDVSVEYRPLPFLEKIDDYSPESANAFAVVLDAAGPDVAKKFHDLLFENQPSEEGPFPSSDDLVDLAVEAGATEGDVRPGIEDRTFEGWVDAAGEAASKAGISSTPSVFVDGKKIEGDGLTIADVAEAMVGPAN
jgi:protein-disulfide isomerase